MKINIKASNLDLTPALNQYIEEKVGSLSKFLKKYEMEGDLNAQVEVARTTRHHHQGDVFRAEINLTLPKKVLRGVAEKNDIRIAIDEVKNELQREIVKYKELSQDFRADRKRKI
ncbi:MAG: ribosome-associated translation inhibitor RaiA [Patescibacteria group bacterium]